MSLNRRDFIKANAVAAAAATAGMAVPTTVLSAEQAGTRNAVRWDKAPCRFCGTGCSVLVGVQNDKVVATQGDPDAPVNRGLNCIKGYFLSKIMYGADRVQTPLLRKKNGVYDKDGEFTPVSWEEALDTMAAKWKAAIKQHGPDSVAMFGSGQWTIWEATRPPSCTRPACAPTTSTPTPATAWPQRWSASCAPSASTSRWAAMTTSSRPTPSCSGARTWPRCTRCSGAASPTAA